MDIQEVLNCVFSAWYPKFKHITIKSNILPLPKEFLDYLQADGIVLPEQCVAASGKHDEDDIEGEELDVDWDSADSSETKMPSFPEFESLIKKIIKNLGGSVFPKLNWSAPRDATWISFDKTLRCTCPSDVYLLLKSSEFITHDLTQPFSHCKDCENKNNVTVTYELVLRKWQSLASGMEFRCFVRNGKLVAICQRNHTEHYEFISKMKDEIVSDIKAFFYHMVAGKFPSKNYVFDAYRRDKGKLLLIDFNPFGAVTDSLLFSWDELEGCIGEKQQQGQQENNELQGSTDATSSMDTPDDKEPIFRFVEHPEGVQPHPYSCFGIPEDIKDLTSGEDPYKLMDLLNLKIQQQGQDASSDEEGD
ncbi:cell division cycle protein 123 homolog [Mizuhopecten yessoensis]|uniref:Cell division cycle protein 123 n=1 Tax=Mizuhopecten yessoensis TaxID=6573 RepID=A0A210PIS9_MIZYE|nr:cell division cycle protein 123 homolog [Mizuhopecten yessoensis]OWF36397.1 Cell division cycle protein 123 [Mizuhopecten yessoensis]